MFVVRGSYLYALNAKTGAYYHDFGEAGRVSLQRQLPWEETYRWTAGPIVVGDVVVVSGNGGSGGGDFGIQKEAAPEDVRGFDARTGKLVWTFHVKPRPGEFGFETWGDAWWYAGAMGAYCALSADEELGYVYVPLTAPGTSLYGGHRPGQNLFGNSLVAIDAKTGRRVWHFQMVHHDLWDYDNIGAPVLGDITVEGKQIKAVMQPNKTGFLYVLDRATGQPVWPIEEQAVPESTIPGEQASPTQPFPTKPPPFDRQGLIEDDLIDFTPELRAEALRVMRQYVTGPIFTPPSITSDAVKGTIVIPGTWGAANWHTPAFDPETAIFLRSVSHASLHKRHGQGDGRGHDGLRDQAASRRACKAWLAAATSGIDHATGLAAHEAAVRAADGHRHEPRGARLDGPGRGWPARSSFITGSRPAAARDR